MMVLAVRRSVEAVIRLFDPAYDVRGITARRRYKGNAGFTLFVCETSFLRRLNGACLPCAAFCRRRNPMIAECPSFP